MTLQQAGIGLIVLGLVAGCAHDTSPTIPAQLTAVKVDTRPQVVERGLTPNTVLTLGQGSRTLYQLSLSPTLTVNRQLEIGPGAMRLIPDFSHGLAYVLHSGENAITLVGGAPLEVVRTLRTGRMTLVGGAVRPGTNELWICDGATAVHILLAPSMQLKSRMTLGRYPQQVGFSPDGAKAFVTLKGENALAVIDAARATETARVPMGIYPSDILVSGQTICVSNFGSHDVSLVDVLSLKERVRIPVRRKPNSLSAQGRLVWVSCEGSYRILAIDVQQDRLIGSVKLGFYPAGILALPDGNLAVADFRHQQVIKVVPEWPADQP